MMAACLVLPSATLGVIVRDGKYYIEGVATIEDIGQFNYNLDGWSRRGLAAKAALVGTHFAPDFTRWSRGDFSKSIASSGHDYGIRANRDARVRLWGVAR